VRLDRQKYTQQNHLCLRKMSLRLSWQLKPKSNKSPVIDQILPELIKAGSKEIRCEIHILIISI